MNKATVIALLIVALLVGAFGGFYYERSKAAKNVDAIKMSMQKQIDEAKATVQKQTMQISPVSMAKEGYVTDPKGMALYIFDKDATSSSTCYDKCAAAWPPYIVSGSVPTTFPAHIGTTKRTDGSVEYTWDNHPLYYYVKDTKPGETTGDNVGGVWHLVK